MKTMLLCLTMTVCLVALGVFNLCYTAKLCEETLSVADAAEAAARSGDFAYASEVLKNSARVWNKKHAVMSVLQNHNDAGRITESILRASSYAAQEEGAQLFTELVSLKTTLKDFMRADLPVLQNIF